VRAGSAPPGKVNRILSWAKAPASIPPSGGVTAWLLSGTVSSPAAVVNGLRPEVAPRGPVMSAITTFIEGEPTVCHGVFGERAQNWTALCPRYLPMFTEGFCGSWGTHQTRKMPFKMLFFRYRHLGSSEDKRSFHLVDDIVTTLH